MKLKLTKIRIFFLVSGITIILISPLEEHSWIVTLGFIFIALPFLMMLFNAAKVSYHEADELIDRSNNGEDPDSILDEFNQRHDRFPEY